MKKFLVIPIFIPHLGCPHKCVFCNQKKITGKTTTVTPSDIRETIEFFLRFKRGKERVEVAFFGGTFTGLPLSLQERFLEVVRPYIEKRDVDYIRLSTRPDYIDRRILDFLKNYGVKIIELGVQSLIDKILAQAMRGHTAQDVERASKLIKESGFVLGHQIMPGLPGDTRDTILETVRRSIEMKPDIVRIYPTLVLEDTTLYDMYRSGTYTPLSLEETVRIVTISYLHYTANNVKIIRIGLQTTDEINEKHIIAGPYHPGIGELIRSEISLWMMLYLLKSVDTSEGIFYASKRDINYLIGYRRKNLKILRDLSFDVNIKVDPTLGKGEVVLKNREKKYQISLVEFSKKVYKNIINIDEVVYEYI